MTNRVDIQELLTEFENFIEYTPEHQEPLEYCPKGQVEKQEDYIPTKITYKVGPKAITIDEYKSRNSHSPKEPTTIKKNKKRTGRKYRIRKEQQRIRHLMTLATGEAKRLLYKQLINTK